MPDRLQIAGTVARAGTKLHSPNKSPLQDSIGTRPIISTRTQRWSGRYQGQSLGTGGESPPDIDAGWVPSANGSTPVPLQGHPSSDQLFKGLDSHPANERLCLRFCHEHINFHGQDRHKLTAGLPWSLELPTQSIQFSKSTYNRVFISSSIIFLVVSFLFFRGETSSSVLPSKRWKGGRGRD